MPVWLMQIVTEIQLHLDALQAFVSTSEFRLWLIQATIVFTFGPPLLFGLVLLLLAGTYMQVMDEEAEEDGEPEELHS